MKQPGDPFVLPDSATIREHADDLAAVGLRVCPGRDETYWVAYPDHIVRRLPPHHVGIPSESEVNSALRATGGLVATFLTTPDVPESANAWLYICSDRDYASRPLPPAMQRNLGRSRRELTLRALSLTELLAHGARAFCDTRTRNGLDDGTSPGFHSYFELHPRLRGRAYLGAWKDSQLAAFATVMHVDDWVELPGLFSMDSMLQYRPNDLLMHALLAYYLSQRSCRTVSYGLSSIQAETNAAGLHRFKRKVGFDAIAVRRTFALHPMLRPFANRVTLGALHFTLNRALRLRPHNRRLKMLEGMLAYMRGSTRMTDAGE